MANQIQGFRLSPQQMRLWPSRPGDRIEVVQCRLLLAGPLQTAALGRALQQVVDRHEILRTTFHHRPGIRFPIQVTAESGSHVWTVVDLKGEGAEAQEARATAVAHEDRLRSFDHERGPLLRATLLALSETSHLLLLTLPALCADSWTLRNLFSEVAAHYGAAPGAEPLEEPTQYVQFSEWQNQLLEGEEGELGRAFWHERTAQAVQEPMLPFARKSAGQNGFEPATHRLSLETCLARQVERVAAECSATAADLLLCCWQILLWRVGGRPGALTLGVGVDGREFEEVHGALGAFNRWLPIGCRFEAGDSFAQVLGEVAEAVRAAYAWQDYYVADELFGARNGHTPLPVRFEFEEWPAQRQAAGVTFTFAEQFNHVEHYVLKLGAVKLADTYSLHIDYDAAQVDEREIARMGERLLTLLTDALNSPFKEVGRLEVLGPNELRQLDEWSRGPAGREPACVHQLFTRQAAQTPDAVAVAYEDEELTYAALDDRSNQLARRLRMLGVGPDLLVGVLLERSTEMVVSLLAVLKAGGAYVPLDPGYPAERVRFMLADSQARVLLTQSRLRESLPETTAAVVCVDEQQHDTAHTDDESAVAVAPENLAYVIYTSGSTGRPKGVMMTHRGLANYLDWCTKAYAVAEGRGTLVHTPLGFDLTVTSLFPSLLTGRRVTLLPEEHAIDELSEALTAGDEFSLVKITPAQLELLAQWLADKTSSSINARAFVIGGEALHWSTLAFWQARAPQARLVNEYGPTETAVGCCVYEASSARHGAGVVPIGRPIAATELYLLDEQFRPVPIGATGELFIGGDGLARGYLNRPGLTAEKFIPHPFDGRGGARLYRTGDLARYLPDGGLEFLARRDEQVKLRGFRVELGEVECVLKEHPAVREVVAAVREEAQGGPRLVAYWVAQAGLNVDDAGLRLFLRERLPHYMIPTAFVRLEALPLTANGKVDRRSLPAPDSPRPKPEAEYVKPRTEVESTIVSIWQEMLRVERVGIADNFFDLGGHSMLMVQLHSRLRAALNRDIPIIDLFGHPTVSSLAEYLSRQEAEESDPSHSRDRADHQRASAQRQRRVRQNLQKQLGTRDR